MVTTDSKGATQNTNEQKETLAGRVSESQPDDTLQPTEEKATTEPEQQQQKQTKTQEPNADSDIQKKQTQPAVDSTRSNWRIQLLYSRGDYDECLALIEQELIATKGLCEYGYHIKGLIRRHQGKVDESLELFQAAAYLNPTNASNLKQTARSLFLLGKHAAALDVYNETQELTDATKIDWEIWHFKGRCYLYKGQVDTAIECFEQANTYERRDATFLELGKAYSQKGDHQKALEGYLEGLEFSPENPDLLTTVGLLYLRLGDNFKAFEYLGNALTYDPRNPRTILAAGSIIQDHRDMEAALVKYRVAATQVPNSPQLWNNIGMCFFGTERYVAAISCLKRALYLSPFEWIVSHNLGLVHLNTGQYASAFQYFSASINLKSSYASTYMYLAITLNRLDDFSNACAAYEKAIGMDSKDHTFRLNYAITLVNGGEKEKAREHYHVFRTLFGQLDDKAKNEDHDLFTMQALLAVEMED